MSTNDLKGTKKMATKKPHKDRSDMTAGTLEKKHGLPPGTVRNPDGRDTRSDKKVGTIRKQATSKTSDSALSQANDHMERAWGKIYARREKNGKAA